MSGRTATLPFPVSMDVCVARAGRAEGFTLLEILLVVMIVGIGSALIIPGFAGVRTSARDEASRVADLIDHAQMMASLRGSALGWTAEPGGYRFLDWNGEWRDAAADTTLAPRQLAEGITLEVVEPVLAAASAGAGGAAAADRVPLPALVFPPSGYPKPFVLRLSSEEGAWKVVGDAAGRVTIAEDARQ